MLREIFVTARKEFRSFFASPAAYIFLGGFLAITLFTFFWIESFFIRNIADMRPMFTWMPVLTIFLAGALTMRSWAEERRAGTLETLMTSPAHLLSLVLGKFLAIEGLVALALLLTLPLSVTVGMLGDLDFGPVLGGYVATLCVAASYVAIGLFVSARTDNAVVSLIITVMAASALYIIGARPLTDLVDRDTAELMAAIGAGSRFNAITRGVLDLRDIYYYLSLVGVFLSLNVFQLHRLRWANNPQRRQHRIVSTITLLVVANLLLANIWMKFVTQARSDLTASSRYTLSDSTLTTLREIEEPLLIRGYFSSQTHPLLAPLVPQIRDLLVEYKVGSGKKLRVEFVNPTENLEAEKSAAEAGIEPTPFQIASRYKSSIVSSYFDILISYGDERHILNFRDLIDVKSSGAEKFEVGLANPEYTLTSAIRKIMQAYQSGADPFASARDGVKFHAYISPLEKMPKDVIAIRNTLIATLEKIATKKKFTYFIEDPDKNDGALAKYLSATYGLSPQISTILNPEPFWFSLRVEGNGRDIPVVLPESGELDEEIFRKA
ncbi:MAG: Gldg family protein, partial [Alphaproteobacteria bacterium]|nr:Gldg family protein [Alphaproteobacteria bacterium]